MYKHFIEGKKLVCFDLDGTIVDTNALFVMAFEKILTLANHDLRVGDVYGKIGESLTEKWGRVVDEKLVKNNMTAKELTDNTYKEFLRLMNEGDLEPKSGFWDIIYKLREDKLLKTALTTNTDKAVAQQVINKLEIGAVFDFMVFGDEVKHKKPNPEMYHTAAKYFGVKPQEMLVFEDSVVGAAAAHKAGASLVVIWDGQTSKSLFPYETLAFAPDFKGIAENLDFTAAEMFENFKKSVSDWEQSQQTQTQPRSES